MPKPRIVRMPDHAAVVDLDQHQRERAEKQLEKYPALGAVYEQMKGVVLAASRDDSMSRFELGLEVSKVREDAEKYGKRAVVSLAALLGYDKATLNDYAQVAQTWPKPEFKALIKRKNGLGLPLTFSHLVALARVKDGRLRNGFTTRALEESLSVRQLEEIIRERIGEPEPVGVAATEGQEIRRSLGQWKKTAVEMERDTQSLLKRARKHPTPDLLALVEQAVTQQALLAKKAADCAEQLQQLLEQQRAISSEDVGAAQQSA